MQHRLILAAFAMLISLLVSPARAEDPTLAGLDLGKYAAGPEIGVNDLRGRVVVIEYWGITCGPCIRSIPHTTELAERYGHDKLIIVANQVWPASDRQCKEVWEQHAKSNFVAVFNGGKVRNFNPTGVPRAIMFDHEGKFIWEGHPASMDQALADAVAKVPAGVRRAADEPRGPEPIVAGIEVRHFAREVEQINAQERSFASALSRLRRAAERSSQDDVVGEATAVLAAVQGWAETQTRLADEAMPGDPATAHAIAERTLELIGGDDWGDMLVELKSKIESDPAVMDVVRSTRMLRETMEQARSIGMTDDPAAAVADRSNARAVREITRDLRRIQSVWPQTDAGRQAGELLDQWGLAGD